MMKSTQTEQIARLAAIDELALASPISADLSSSDPRHVSAGDVLWTLTHGESTAQARRWASDLGFEFEMLVWTGARVDGQEDLCWSQLFPSEEAVAATALARKSQLLASGWLEELETSVR